MEGKKDVQEMEGCIKGVGNEDAGRWRSDGTKTRDGHEQSGGQIMQTEMRRRNEVKGILKGRSACWKMT